MLLDQALRERGNRGTPIGADALIERVQAELEASPVAVPLAPSAVRVPRRRAALVFAAAFILVIGAIGVIFLLPDRSPQEPAVTTTIPVTTVVPSTTSTTDAATTTSAAATTTTTTASTTIPPMPSSLGIVWQQIEAPVLQGGWIAAVTEGGPGLIAVGGTRSGDIHPNNGQAFYQVGVWLSPDGVNWERVDSPDFSVEDEFGTGAAFMTDVVVGSASYVGVGWAGGRAAVWTSPDGREWQRVPHDDAVFGSSGEVRHVVAASFGLVAVGVAAPAEGEEEEVMAWVSADGSEWIRSPIGIGVPPPWSDPLSVATTRMDVTAWNDLVVVVGALDRGEEWTYRPAVWITADGITWETITDGSGGTIPIPEEDDATLAAVAPYGDGLMAMGWSGDVANWRTSPTIWTSQNGRDWQMGPGAFFPEQPGMSYATLLTTADRTVLASSFDKGGDLFGSADGGASWHLLGTVDGGLGVEAAETEGDRIFFTINDVDALGDVVIAAGRTLKYSGAGDFAGTCMWDPRPSAGACRTDAAVWIGTWEE
jgi:hypothetical protein